MLPLTPDSEKSHMIIDQAPHACFTCKRRKRKCTKTLPKCSLCRSKDLPCIYGTANLLASEHSPSEDEHPRALEVAPQPLAEATSIAGYTPTISNPFPGVFFLDHEVFQHCHLEIPKPSLPAPSYIQDFIKSRDEAQAIALQYFDSIHYWMPFISKKRFFEHLLNPFSGPRSDVTFLLFCMKLIAWLPSESGTEPRNELYLAAKRAYVEMELSGILTLPFLQAGVLIALYEIGHAIYPAAFIAPGALARYGQALRINDETEDTHSLSWVQKEEKRRVWWTIVILDRVVALGHPSRQFATVDLHPSDILPSDDTLWNSGITPTSDSPTLSSPIDLNSGRFALMIHAVNLLSRVLVRALESEMSEIALEEKIRLTATIKALITYSLDGSICYSESRLTILSNINAVSLCYSALIILHSNDSYPGQQLLGENQSSDQEGRMIIEQASEHIIQVSEKFLEAMDENLFPIGLVTFLALPLTYQVALLFQTPKNPEVAFQKRKVLEETLHFISEHRWRSAESYLQLLKARDAMDIR